MFVFYLALFNCREGSVICDYKVKCKGLPSQQEVINMTKALSSITIENKTLGIEVNETELERNVKYGKHFLLYFSRKRNLHYKLAV